MQASPFSVAATALAFLLATTWGHAADEDITGGLSPNGEYKVQLAEPASIAVFKVNTQIAKFPLRQPRIPDQDAAPCSVVWDAESRAFAVLDHENRLSTQLAVYAVHDGRVQNVPIPDYTQNALGRVDAVASALPCENRIGQWSGDDLPILLMFAATNSAGVWRVYHATINLHFEATPYPRIKLTEVKILDGLGAQRK